MALVARGRPLEARHFGYGVLQHVCAERWDEFAADERQHLAKLAWEKLTELVAGAAGDAAGGSAPAPEPFVIKSKAATLLATVVRREGAALWAGVVPDLCAMTSSADADAAELAALVTRYVAEDVAVYNSDIIGGRMKDLLGGLTATLPQTLPALYRGLEVRVFREFFRLFPLPAPPGFVGSKPCPSVLSEREEGGLLHPLEAARPPVRAPMTNTPSRINHPNIPVWLKFLTLFRGAPEKIYACVFFVGFFFKPGVPSRARVPTVFVRTRVVVPAPTRIP